MKPSLSVVIPALDDVALLWSALSALEPELAAATAEHEIVVVDDTGSGALAEAFAHEAMRVRWVVQPANEGYARALTAGLKSARFERALCLNPDMRVRAGSLASLCAALDDARTFAVVPRVLLHGREQAVESWVALQWNDGRLRLCQPALEGQPFPLDPRPTPVPFAIGGAMLLWRELFFSLGGFDPLFEPFYFEDVDLGLRAWRASLRVHLVPAAVFEHGHRGTIGRVARPEWIEAVIARNELLCAFKHADDVELGQHLEHLEREVLAAWMSEDRMRLETLGLVLEARVKLQASRAALVGGRRSLAELCRLSAPFSS